MTARCPQGHDSESTDYCDVCGSPMTGPGAPDVGGGGGGGGPSGEAPAPAAAQPVSGGLGLDLSPAPEPQQCPHCGALNVAEALFCESCGYDFTTGAEPLGDTPRPASALDLNHDQDPHPEPQVERAEVKQPTEPAEGSAAPTAESPEPRAQTPGDGAAQRAAAPSPVAPSPVAPPAAAPAPPAGSATGSTPGRPAHLPPSRRTGSDWVVELWVDPDWYAVQDTDEACPSPDVPDIIPVRGRSQLIGRPSASRSVRPDIDCGGDTAVSRRHAQLTSDGRRWWLEDLGSSNGTFVGPAAGPLPTERLTPGQRVELDVDDRVYVGAWTRLVLRRATESEKAGTG